MWSSLSAGHGRDQRRPQQRIASWPRSCDRGGIRSGPLTKSQDGDPAEWAIGIKMCAPEWRQRGAGCQESSNERSRTQQSCGIAVITARIAWSIVGRWTAGAGNAPSPSETDEVTNVGA